MTLYKDFIAQNKTLVRGPEESNVSALNSRKGGGGGGGGKGKGDDDKEVEDRYNTAKEYATLSTAKKRKLKEMCEARDPARKKQRKANANDVSNLVRQVSALTAALTEDDDAAMEDSNEEEKDTPRVRVAEESATSNRGHPGLTRQKTILKRK